MTARRTVVVHSVNGETPAAVRRRNLTRSPADHCGHPGGAGGSEYGGRCWRLVALDGSHHGVRADADPSRRCPGFLCGVVVARGSAATVLGMIRVVIGQRWRDARTGVVVIITGKKADKNEWQLRREGERSTEWIGEGELLGRYALLDDE